jgi:catechol 2,3-dioxygenase-like lactoylglutathione lyase family enzyme
MIDHVELFVRDKAQSVTFFQGALAPMGYALHVPGTASGAGTGAAAGFGAAPDVLDFWVREGGPSAPLPHVAFHCTTRELVDRCHAAAMRAGAKERSGPKLFPTVHPHYYAAQVYDPDGHNIEFACHKAE